jgi:hypothetical protein
MRKMLIAAMAVAAAMSVPLAGPAWADTLSVGAAGQGGESSAQANGPIANPSGEPGEAAPGAQGGLVTDLEFVNKDAGTTFAGRIDVTFPNGVEGTASGTSRDGQFRGHFTGNLSSGGECSGLCP